MRIEVDTTVNCGNCVYGLAREVAGEGYCRWEPNGLRRDCRDWCRHAVTPSGRRRFTAVCAEDQPDETVGEVLDRQASSRRRVPEVGDEFRVRSLGDGEFFGGLYRCVSQAVRLDTNATQIVAAPLNNPSSRITFSTIGFEFVAAR